MHRRGLRASARHLLEAAHAATRTCRQLDGALHLTQQRIERRIITAGEPQRRRVASEPVTGPRRRAWCDAGAGAIARDDHARSLQLLVGSRHRAGRTTSGDRERPNRGQSRTHGSVAVGDIASQLVDQIAYHLCRYS
jgi:hypothetical protein